MEDTYGENCISGILHSDENSYHLHFLICPVDHRLDKKEQKVYKLNARAITGGKVKLQAIQDSYASAVRTCGLRRGIKGSQASHTSLKQYYTALNESKKACEKSGMNAPTSNPDSFNHWQKIVTRLSESFDEEHEAEINKLEQIIRDLITTNQKLEVQIEANNQVKRPCF